MGIEFFELLFDNTKGNSFEDRKVRSANLFFSLSRSRCPIYKCRAAIFIGPSDHSFCNASNDPGEKRLWHIPTNYLRCLLMFDNFGHKSTLAHEGRRRESLFLVELLLKVIALYIFASIFESELSLVACWTWEWMVSPFSLSGNHFCTWRSVHRNTSFKFRPRGRQRF